MKCHRDLPPIPVDSAARRTEVMWLMNHKLWVHDFWARVPPDTEDWFTPIFDDNGDIRYYKVADNRDDWLMKNVGSGSLHECLCIEYVYVDPTTERIEDDPERNTEFRVWLEAGGWSDLSGLDDWPAPKGGWTEHNKWIACHDPDLDCGAPDLETALLELARLVRFFYTDDGERRDDAPVQCEGYFKDNDYSSEDNWVSICVDDGNGYCANCGFVIEDE